jgi:hypothetical protein
MSATEAEKNEVLSAFMGWTPRECSMCYDHLQFWSKGHHIKHDIPPTDYFADTPEAAWAVKKLKDEFVRQTGRPINVRTSRPTSESPVHYYCKPFQSIESESNAVADAICRALVKEQR